MHACRLPDTEIREAGRWNDGSAYSNSYSSAPNGGSVAMLHGYPGSAQEAGHNHICGQGALLPSDAVTRLMMPAVLQLHDMHTLDVVAAHSWAQDYAREQKESVPLVDLLACMKACARAMAQVRSCVHPSCLFHHPYRAHSTHFTVCCICLH